MKLGHDDGAFASLLAAHDLRFSRNGLWLNVGPPVPRTIGWKLHLSSSVRGAEKLLGLVLPYLRDEKVTFKIAASPTVLGALNAGNHGATQIGKFVTIYPAEDAKLRSLVQRLRSLLRRQKGPRIVTDLRLGAVLYARFGAFQLTSRRDRLGRWVMFGQVGGVELEDRYTVPFECPPEGLGNVHDYLVSVSKDSDRQSSLLDERYLLIDVLNASARGSTYLALDLLENGAAERLVVLKEGRFGCQEDASGRERTHRLLEERKILFRLVGHALVPKPLDLFREGLNSYLVLEYLWGDTLIALARHTWGRLRPYERQGLKVALMGLIEQVRRLHVRRIVHRDLKPTNVLWTERGTCLIDFDIAAVVGGSAASRFGTPGYTSPEQNNASPASFADDIYSLGALFGVLLAGCDERVLEDTITDPARFASVSGVSLSCAKFIARCLASPDARPSLEEVRLELERLLEINSLGSGLRPTNKLLSSPASVREGVLKGLLLDVGFDEARNLWVSERTDQGSAKHVVCRGLNRGVSGPLYGIAKMFKGDELAKGVRDVITNAVTWLLSETAAPDLNLPGLHFGDAGVALSLSLLVKRGFIEDELMLRTRSYINEHLKEDFDWLDFTHGAAGQGTAMMECGNIMQDSNLLCRAKSAVQFVVQLQDEEGKWTVPPGIDGMSGKDLYGFAHGVAGIQFFLALAASRGPADIRPLAATSAERAGIWLRQQERKACRKGSWSTDPTDSGYVMRWCHGSPGIALGFLAMFQMTEERQWADLARSALRQVPNNLRGNLSQCCGLSGIGEIFLEAERILNEEIWGERAMEIAEYVYGVASRSRNGGLSWPERHGVLPTADFMGGSSGIGHFLYRASRRTMGHWASGPTWSLVA